MNPPSWLSRWFRSEPAHLRTGRWGEGAAERLLRRKGYRILARRVRLRPREEIDLVARQGRVLVFVEVKTRADERFARPAAAVNRTKQRRLARAAARYLARIKERPDAFRFDIVEVVGTPDGPAPVIRHLESAFLTPVDTSPRW